MPAFRGIQSLRAQVSEAEVVRMEAVNDVAPFVGDESASKPQMNTEQRR